MFIFIISFVFEIGNNDNGQRICFIAITHSASIRYFCLNCMSCCKKCKNTLVFWCFSSIMLQFVQILNNIYFQIDSPSSLFGSVSPFCTISYIFLFTWFVPFPNVVDVTLFFWIRFWILFTSFFRYHLSSESSTSSFRVWK